MNGPTSEDLALPYRRPAIVASIIVVLVVMALFGVDRLRVRQRLAELQKQFCTIAIPESQLHRMDLLADFVTMRNSDGRQLIQALNAIAPGGGTIEVFFEVEGTIWCIPTWGNVTPSVTSQLPAGFQRWTELAVTECAGIIEEQRLRIFRSVRTPAGRTAVLVLSVSRDRGFD
jgi:hypothetical protein